MGRDMTICNLLAVRERDFIPPRFGAGTEDAAEIFAAIAPELTRFMAWEPPASPTAHADANLTSAPGNRPLPESRDSISVRIAPCR
jgi:hypothetical protein